MPNPVVVSDVEARFRPLSDAERTVAEALINDAWAVVLASRPNLEQHLQFHEVTPEVVTFVVSAMVLRVMRNPDGVKQWSIDDASFTRDSALSAGGLYLSPSELALLSPGAGSSAAFTIRPIVDYRANYIPDPWVQP